MGSLSIWHWLIVLLVVVLIFGTKKLRNMGSDVGGAVKNFKEAMHEESATTLATQSDAVINEVIVTSAVEVAPKSKVVTKPVAEKKVTAPKVAVAKPKAPTTTKAPAKAKAVAKPKAPTTPKAPAKTKAATKPKAIEEIKA